MSKCLIRRFDISQMKPDGVTLVVGKRGTGKSSLLLDIFSNQRRAWDIVMAFAGSIEARESLRTCIPSPFVHKGFSQDILAQFVAQADKLKEDGIERSFCAILDDCMYDKKILKNNIIREIFMNGRHLNMGFFFAVQYLMDIGPDLRCQIDYIFALKENIVSNRKKLWNFFFGVFENYQDFSVVMDRCTNDYECLVLDNRVCSNNVEDCIFWYKASLPIPKFRLANRAYWSMTRCKLLKEKKRVRQRKVGKTITFVEKATNGGQMID